MDVPLLQGWFPELPSTLAQFYTLNVAIVCPILLAYSVFIEQEHRQDLIRLVGATGLFGYALLVGNMVFMIAMGAVMLASAIEFFEILVGLHKHGKEDLKKYKQLWRIKKD